MNKYKTTYPLVLLKKPNKLSAKRLDALWASGWFRSAEYMYRAPLVYLPSVLVPTIYIRLHLNEYNRTKKHEKIYRKNKNKFTVKFGKFQTNDQKENLYQQTKHKFLGYILPDLQTCINGYGRKEVFPTYECAVYDQEKLIALSVFDLGSSGISSLLAVYDQSYNKYSLGTYTMLEEIEFAKSLQIKYYYPGYITPGHTGLDYKLSLGTYWYYNWKGQWCKKAPDPMQIDAWARLINKNDQLAQTFANKIVIRKHIYPLYMGGYMQEFGFHIFRAPFIFLLDASYGLGQICLVYHFEKDCYQLYHYSIIKEDKQPFFEQNRISTSSCPIIEDFILGDSLLCECSTADQMFTQVDMFLKNSMLKAQ